MSSPALTCGVLRAAEFHACTTSSRSSAGRAAS